jgi:hypothetical protein
MMKMLTIVPATLAVPKLCKHSRHFKVCFCLVRQILGGQVHPHNGGDMEFDQMSLESLIRQSLKVGYRSNPIRDSSDEEII